MFWFKLLFVPCIIPNKGVLFLIKVFSLTRAALLRQHLVYACKVREQNKSDIS